MPFIEIMYLDWVNNFLSVQAFADHHHLSLSLAHTVINEGRTLNHSIR